MPMQWNDQADARLFANVLKLHVVKLDYVAIARQMGMGVTPKAISHRISKIKEKANQYRRDHPYAFGPEDEKPSKKRRTHTLGYKKVLQDDEETKAEPDIKVKPEPGLEEEGNDSTAGEPMKDNDMPVDIEPVNKVETTQSSGWTAISASSLDLERKISPAPFGDLQLAQERVAFDVAISTGVDQDGDGQLQDDLGNKGFD